MFDIRPLRSCEFDALLECWNRAFSDYKVPINKSHKDLNIMLTQNGIDYTVSVAAFKEGQMVGFLLNGLREYDGELTGYDTGTAIVPEHRGIGLSNLLFKAAEKILKERGVRRYLLEVICDNERAYNVYLKNGFHVSRKFLCLKADGIIGAKGSVDRMNIVNADPEECAQLIPEMIEYKTSWQNSTMAVFAVRSEVASLIAKPGGKAIGYGFFERSHRRILQLGALPAYRNNGVFEAIINAGYDEIGGNGTIAALNLPDDARATKSSLEKCGFKPWVSQYEMIKNY